jgi:two-component system LytT family response regulator
MKLKCILIDDEPHALSEMEDLIHLSPNLTLVKSFQDTIQAVAYLQQNEPVEIIFSDINMPLINGMDAAGIYKRHCEFLIYVTAHREYALEAFGVNASAYLVKPVSKTIFLEKIDEITNKHFLPPTRFQRNESILFVKGSLKNSFVRIDINDIIFIQALLNYCVIHTTSGNHITYMGLKEIVEKLRSKEIFLRVSKSIIVSAKFIKRIEGNMVHLINQNNYAIGNSYKCAFHDYITKRTLNNA